MKNHLSFSWILEGSLAGAEGPTTPQDLLFFKRNDILALIRMEQRTISGEPWSLVDMFEPVPDFTPPNLEQIQRMVKFIKLQIETWERPVVVTCAAGIGRTGTVLACYLVSTGYAPEDAIQFVRGLRPGSIQTRAQQDAVHDYAGFLKSQPKGPSAP
ncbi:MAG: protein tyrosine phosphatase [Dehalococcoidia bacterium]|nr:protein tyrosine phosphatase [Dehalococcoidia bacterium]MSQ16417.1 protein tyrosine phosphatase [Dehalococcoidia bacterium]